MPYKDPEARRAYIREYQRRWVAARRAEYLADKVCANCGDDFGLEIDHVDRSQKVSNRIWSWSKERREAELAKCQVLCQPCHVAKGVAAGDFPRGEAHRCARLTEAQVREIRARRAEGQTFRRLAHDYAISQRHVRDIVSGRKWKHVPAG